MRLRATVLVLVATALSALLPVAPADADEVRDLQWHLRFLDVAAAHRISQGTGVVVAVVDTGVDAAHPDLTGNVLPGVDFVDEGGNGQRDEDGHGTGMAGLVAAHGRASAGALGIAPQAKILPIRIARASSSRFGDHGLEGLSWAVAHGANIICFANVISDTPQLRQVIERTRAADVVVVAAVGNRPTAGKVEFPAAYRGVLAAAGVDQNGNHAQVSVTGPEVVLAAPAVDIVSTSQGGRYRKGTGTSDAAAILAGAAALVRAKFPNLSAEEVIHRLTATAIDKGTPGRDGEYGYGVVDLVAALTKDVPPLKPASQPPVTSAPPAGSPASNGHPKPVAVIVAIVTVLVVVGAVGTLVAVRRRQAS